MRRSFQSQIEDFGKVVHARMDEICFNTATFLLNEVQNLPEWPVWTGWSRASWFITLDSDSDYTYQPRPRPKAVYSGGKQHPPLSPIGIPGANIPDVRWGDKVHIMNNVPYVGKLPKKNGIFDNHPDLPHYIKMCVQRAQRNVVKEAKRLCK